MSKRNSILIETDRLTLREIINSDAELIVKWRSDSTVYRFFKSPHKISLEEHLEWFFNTYLHNNNRLDLIAVEKSSGNRVGVFGLVKENDRAEISYLLDPREQHKGLAIEAVSALISFAKKNWNSKQIIAEIHMDNNSSINLVKKLGFVLFSTNNHFLTFRIEV